MKINFLGDSITEGAGAGTEENKYVNVVGAMLGAEVRNYGVSGTRLARQSVLSVCDVYDNDFQIRMQSMANTDGDADRVFVFGGTNDYGHGDAPIGHKDDDTPYSFYGAINNIVTFLTEKYGKEKLCFLLPMPRYNQDNVFGEGNKKCAGLTLGGYVKIIKERLDFYQVDYIDLFEGFIPVPQVNTGDEYTVDGLHPNAYGHKLLAERIVEYIKEKMGK